MSLFRNIVWYIKGSKEYTKAGYEVACKHFNSSDLDVNLNSRSFLVTGANSGIGKLASLLIAKKGGTVHMICRNKERGEAAQQELKTDSGNENVHLHIVDMSRPKEIKNFVQEFKSSGQQLNVLVNNAGVLVAGDKRQVTDDGLEMTFATNSIGVHILTKGLVPVLEQYDDPRVIIVSSGGMLVQKLDLKDMQFEKPSKFDGTLAYAQTKRQQVIMTEQYAKSYPKIHFSSMHPGWSATPGVKSSIPDFYNSMNGKLRTEEQGADTIVWLAASAKARTHPSGLFFQDRKPVATHLPLAWTKSSADEENKLMKEIQRIADSIGGPLS